MKFIKQFSSETEMNDAISQIKHGDGVFLFGVSTANGIESMNFCNHIHPGPNCVKLNPVNMTPVKLDSSSIKKKPVVGDVLYSTADGRLTLDTQTNNVDNTAIAICVIPEVMENFKNGDDSEGAVKTARFISINYMSCKTPTTGSETYIDQFMMFGNQGVTIGNVKGGSNKTSYVGGKWNTQQCLSKATNQDQYICNGITNSSDDGYCAPACCCVAYSTLGTKPGDWYLPSVGELYQFYANKAVINEKRTKLVNSGFINMCNCWSSKETRGGGSMYVVNIGNGGIGQQYNDWLLCVFGFLALEV